MRILVDENIPRATVAELIALGHDVFDVRGTDLQGIQDDELWELAQSEQRLLITSDKEFSSHRTEDHFGILVVRLRQPNRQSIHERVLAVMRSLPERDWPGSLVVVRDSVMSQSQRKKDDSIQEQPDDPA